MIDERKEELAAMYALGVMEPQEAHAFEAEMRADVELRKFVDDLLHSSAAMVHACPAKSAPLHLREKILEKFGDEKVPSTASMKSNEGNKVIPFFRPLTWLPWAMAAGLMITCGWLYGERGKLQEQLEAEQNKRDVCEIQLAILDPMGDKAHGSATVAWDSTMQTGVITAQDMPRPAANEDYQLWVMDDQHEKPVDAGVVRVGDKGAMKAMFKPKQKISDTGKFAISIEPKGGMPQPSGKIVMLGGK